MNYRVIPAKLKLLAFFVDRPQVVVFVESAEVQMLVTGITVLNCGVLLRLDRIVKKLIILNFI